MGKCKNVAFLTCMMSKSVNLHTLPTYGFSYAVGCCTDPFELFTIGVPVRLSDSPLHPEGQKKSLKNCPQWGLKPGPPDHQANALPTERGRRSVGREISEVSLVCFMHHCTCWTSFISRINRAWLYKDHEDSGWQLYVDLAQLVEHWPHDLEVLVSIPSGGNFWRFVLLFPV